jgi:hypothetical protein
MSAASLTVGASFAYLFGLTLTLLPYGVLYHLVARHIHDLLADIGDIVCDLRLRLVLMSVSPSFLMLTGLNSVHESSTLVVLRLF